MSENQNQNFVKTVQLSGPQKAAILLGELDSSFLEYLKTFLTKKEFKKLTKEFFKLGVNYNPKDSFEVNRELSVLYELEDYGKKRGIYKEVPHFVKTTQNNESDFSDIIKNDPNSLAKVLSKWLKED